MRHPETILNTLSSHSTDSHYKYERLYRILFNEKMFSVAYQYIVSNPSHMTFGTDGQTIDRMRAFRIKSIIDSLKDESYQPNPTRGVNFRQQKGKLRPFCLPSFNDKLLQEVVKMILEAIYEGYFEDTSHGFRPCRNSHTALKYIQHTFTGVTWFIKGHIQGFFDNLNREILISILRERIADERFIRLICKFIKAGCLEREDCLNTRSGIPQSGTLSHVLANIYLNEFDKYMQEYAASFDKGAQKQVNSHYQDWADSVCRFSKETRDESGETTKEIFLDNIKQTNKIDLSEPLQIPMDDNVKRLRYVRYADDFLIGVIGSKQDCQEIKQAIIMYMEERLKLKISAEDTLITHSSKHAKFLGFNITVKKSRSRQHTKQVHSERLFSSKVVFNIGSDVVKSKLQSYDAIRFTYDRKGKMRWMPKSRPQLLSKTPEEILAIYNSQIQGFYHSYGIAHNSSSQCWAFAHIMEYSLYMTIGQKQRMSLREVIYKYSKNKQFSISYMDKGGRRKRRILRKNCFKRKGNIGFPFMDCQPRTYVASSLTSSEGLQNGYCAVCGKPDGIVMYHDCKLHNFSGNPLLKYTMP